VAGREPGVAQQIADGGLPLEGPVGQQYIIQDIQLGFQANYDKAKLFAATHK